MLQKLIFFKKLINSALIVGIVFLLACASTKDVTDNAKYHLGYKPGERYLVKSKVYLIKYNNYALSPPQLAGNPDFDSYAASKNKWPNILGIVDIGTELRISRIIEKKTIESHDLWVFAKITKGYYKGQEVFVDFISLSVKNLPYGYPNTDRYNPKYLEPLE
ncbi:MAG: hypothetical protein WAZ60_02280 [Desulfosalsimonadaceae bacterium]